MPTMSGTTSKYSEDILLTKQLNTTLAIEAKNKYVDRDVEFILSVQSGVSAANTASADVDVQSGGTGTISGVIGSKTTAQPSSGYYIKLQAEGSGSSKILTSGWVNSGALAAASTTATKYFPIQAATGSVSGTNTVTPSASVSGTNVVLSNTNNGIAVIATGGGTAAASVNATSSQAGYMPAGTAIDSKTINAASQSTTAVSYISGVTIPVPASGTNVFTVTLPNGEGDTITMDFEVDSNGNSNITSDDITSTKLNAVLISGDNYRLESEV